MSLTRALDLSFGTALRHLAILAMLWLAILFLFILGQRFGVFGQKLTLHPDSLASVNDADGREVSIYSLLPRDAIRSIDAPRFVDADEAARWMRDSEQVLGLVIGDEVRAYPINMLSRHEIVNDVVGGTPVVISYCPLCFTAIVYDRRVEGETLEFGVSGKLVMNDLVMYDRQTGSLWQQILGEGIDGQYLGTKLSHLPAIQTTWARWVQQNPDTLVLDKRGDYQSDSYQTYYGQSSNGVIPGSGGDDRLNGKDLVLGVVLNNQPRAYPFSVLADVGIVNDSVGGTPILITYDLASDTAVAFERAIEGRELTFRGSTESAALLEDVETGSRWSAFTGEAIEGPLEGSQLQQTAATYAFWFAWSDFYTQTGVYAAD